MKDVLEYLRGFSESVLGTTMLVVAICFLLIQGVSAWQSFIETDANGRPLVFEPVADDISEKQEEVINISNVPDWTNRPELLDEYDKLTSGIAVSN